MRHVVILLLLFASATNAQFDPAGGELGSKSVHKNSESIYKWASSATVTRGPMQIDSPLLGMASVGEDINAVGPMDGMIVSLGDGGIAEIVFDEPILNGEGYDFAIFENGFKVGLSYYLELAHVEVSLDGINYTRFPSETVIDTSFQINNFSYLNPEEIYNLAGKHQAPYGTLFDLEEIGLSEIKYMRIIDVIGNIDSLGSRDSKGRLINDPWPSPFESSGFDLDAVAAVNGQLLATEDLAQQSINVYPSLASPFQDIKVDAPAGAEIQIVNTHGAVLFVASDNIFTVDNAGVYIVRVVSDGQMWHKKFIVN